MLETAGVPTLYSGSEHVVRTPSSWLRYKATIHTETGDLTLLLQPVKCKAPNLTRFALHKPRSDTKEKSGSNKEQRSFMFSLKNTKLTAEFFHFTALK